MKEDKMLSVVSEFIEANKYGDYDMDIVLDYGEGLKTFRLSIMEVDDTY